jgi:uncharacterized protein (UPF0248 family)
MSDVVAELENATVVLDDDGVTTRHKNETVVVHEAWVEILTLTEDQYIPRHRVEEVFRPK